MKSNVFLRDKTWAVHVPRRIKELGPRIKSAVETLTTELQRSPKVVEIAEYLEVEEEDVLEAMEMGKSYQALSMDHSLESDSDGSSITLFDVIGQQDDGYEKTDQRMLVANALSVLSEREKQVIQFTYIDQLSQKEAGEKLGISQMHVSRLQRKAIKKLQDAIHCSWWSIVMDSIRHPYIEVFVYQEAKEGNNESGDTYFTYMNEEYFLCAIADGLGNGPIARQSSEIIPMILAEYHHETIDELIVEMQ